MNEDKVKSDNQCYVGILTDGWAEIRPASPWLNYASS